MQEIEPDLQPLDLAALVPSARDIVFLGASQLLKSGVYAQNPLGGSNGETRKANDEGLAGFSLALLRIGACQKTIGCFAPLLRCCQQQHVCLFTVPFQGNPL
jgi:hypothetical protein